MNLFSKPSLKTYVSSRNRLMPFLKPFHRRNTGMSARAAHFSATYDRYAPYVFALAVKVTGHENGACKVVRDVFKVLWEREFALSVIPVEINLSVLLLMTKEVAARIQEENELSGWRSEGVREVQAEELMPALALRHFLLDGMSTDEIATHYHTGVNHIKALITAALRDVIRCAE